MQTYSILRTGKCYLVRAGEKSILKVADGRIAARLVAEAAELLSSVRPRDCRGRRVPIHQSAAISAKFLDDSRRFP
jgi:hypothetical protein